MRIGFAGQRIGFGPFVSVGGRTGGVRTNSRLPPAPGPGAPQHTGKAVSFKTRLVPESDPRCRYEVERKRQGAYAPGLSGTGQSSYEEVVHCKGMAGPDTAGTRQVLD